MKKHYIYRCVAVLLLAVALSVTAFAAGETVIDWEAAGSVTLTLADSNDQTPVAGAEITIYQVAEAGSRDSQLVFTFTKDFAGCGLSLDDLNDVTLAEKLAAFAGEKNLAGMKTGKTGKDGTVSFTELPLGFYLLVQTKNAEGYSACMPFTVSIPTSDSTGWLYDIQAAPKTGVIKLMDLTVRKVWSGSGSHPDSVTVELKKNGESQQTVKLNAENQWTYTWKDLAAREVWTVEEVEVPAGYTVTYETLDNVVTITNISKLPQTGQLNWPIPVLIAGGLLLLAVGWVLVFHRKKKNDA